MGSALAADVLAMKPAKGIPSWLIHVMDVPYLEKVSGHPSGALRQDPDRVYVDFQRAIGTCMIDQYLAGNVLSMGATGYESDTGRTATTGVARIERDGISIDSPEAVVEHLERCEFPRLERAIAATPSVDDREAIDAIIARERDAQNVLGPSILKAPYGEGFNNIPGLRYYAYGYEQYLMAYLIYPEVMERDFSLQADLAERRNRLAARAIEAGHLATVTRLDHDMAGSSGTIVDIHSLDQLWFPHFARAIRPYVEAGIRCVWHCDGNLMEMVPRLIDAGVGGFQGFQYEDGMDYERICRMTDREGGPLMIWAGVSVSSTLPFGTPDNVRDQLAWLVEHAPPVGFFLGASSSIVPGTPWANLEALVQGLKHYRGE